MATSSSLTAILLLLIHALSTTSQAYQNFTLGASLFPLGQNTSWPSPSGDFAFGFHPLDATGLFLLAVWFDKIPDKTIVWYGNQTVEAGSRLDLTSDGNLSLKDHTGNEVWSAGNTYASHLAMLDDGNLVLVRSDGSPGWQTFTSPTDTILPSQNLPLGSRLRCKLTDADYSPGRFRLDVQTDGNLVMYPISLPTDNIYNAYWASNTLGNGTQLLFDLSGNIDLLLKDGTKNNFTSSDSNPRQELYQRGTLDPDGVFRQYVHSKVNNSEGWTAVSFQPPDICQAVNSQTGSGACGFNAYCKSGAGNANQRVDCECPPKYSFSDPTREYKGCKPDFPVQSCDADGDSELFEFVEVKNVDWPNSDYEFYNPIGEDGCRNQCLSDCFCGAAIYNAGSCWKKKLPLSKGRMGSYIQRVALIKVSKSSIDPVSSGGKKGSGTTWIILGSSLLAGSLLLIVVVAMIWNRRRRKVQPEENPPALSLKCFSYKELKTASNGFSEELGSGAFGTVYKGHFQSNPKTCVAIKKLDKLLQETEKEFAAEIQSIGRTHHKNLARLLGFCKEGTQRLLVYEYMSNGSLNSFLFGGTRPGWNQRIQIALGIARGLLYLHEECSTQIIHCDIKPQNILLDENRVARISDFGLAKLLKSDQTRTHTGIRGTKGYVAPEWFKNSAITAKVDVYSYGIMLLEIVSCRKNVEPKGWDDDEAILAFWAYDCYRDGRVDRLVEGDEEAMGDIRTVERLVAVAIWCIQEEPSLRPGMLRVTQMLDGAVPVQVAPDPSC